MTAALLALYATEVRGHIGGSDNRDCAGTGANTEQRGVSRNGVSGKYTAFQVHSVEIQYQRSARLEKWRTHNTGQNRGARGVHETAVGSMHVVFLEFCCPPLSAHTSSDHRVTVAKGTSCARRQLPCPRVGERRLRLHEGLHVPDSSYRARECENKERAMVWVRQ